ncbi:hypothetical protein F5887DRAFT_1165399 [Amanita rubescens]|nr:hypothetical protein F5887DRAFT_1165399 [Amanita rubescens]
MPTMQNTTSNPPPSAQDSPIHSKADTLASSESGAQARRRFAYGGKPQRHLNVVARSPHMLGVSLHQHEELEDYMESGNGSDVTEVIKIGRYGRGEEELAYMGQTGRSTSVTRSKILRSRASRVFHTLKKVGRRKPFKLPPVRDNVMDPKLTLSLHRYWIHTALPPPFKESFAKTAPCETGRGLQAPRNLLMP